MITKCPYCRKETDVHLDSDVAERLHEGFVITDYRTDVCNNCGKFFLYDIVLEVKIRTKRKNK